METENSFIRLESDDLRSVIADLIAREGSISTARFMELALYHPGCGYYETKGRIGKSGDFMTNVSVGNLFGGLICEQLRQWTEEQTHECLHWVEAGAHDGQLAGDILDHCQNHHPETYKAIDYRIIEPSETRRRCQEHQLERHSSKVQWSLSWEAHRRNSISGVIFSNELLDAFPVERLCWDAAKRQWRQWGVSLQDGDLHWCLLSEPLPQSALGFSRQLPAALFEHLPDGFTTELGAAANHWWRQAAARLAAGYLFTIDYGLSAPEFFAPHRHQGTLRAYSRHRQSLNLLENPGQQDLTSHVNFTTLQETGESEGLETVALQSQEQFLTGIFKCLLKNGRQAAISAPSRIRQFQSLTHPDHFGRSFSVLIQRRPALEPVHRMS